ncbi:MAG: DnaJ domain-containing protein [Candidatus Tectomicrobia bacterium]|uniref:DnaJ domain-containing protein n=1 Tax=Tectimicrobiota bacterium TaxID=2528274 RepID=A0A932FWF1_UNCTE|nr:DnaJ domain-containing protein [Candidatus Tectomicrobia bacterium]
MGIGERLYRLARAHLRSWLPRTADRPSFPWEERFSRDPAGPKKEAEGERGHTGRQPGGPRTIPYRPDLAQYYANLEVPYGSDLATVRSAWKRMMKKYHPDLHSHNPEKCRTATLLTQRLTEAYQELEKALKDRAN